MSERTLSLTLIRGRASQPTSVPVRNAVIAGWTGRDRAAVEKHIEELAALGVKRPASVPLFYRISAVRVTTTGCIEVLGETSSGEVEFVLLQYGGHLWLGVGSDHTDRDVETFNIGVSKQMCDKPAGSIWWSFDEIAPHWDRLILRSHVGPERILYQEGSVNSLLEPAELIARYAGCRALPDKTMMFCGTLPAHGGVRPSRHFAIELEDPVLDRKIRHEYRIDTLPATQ
jgi:hypothetical protein